MQLRINRYRRSSQETLDDVWCRVDFSLEVCQQLKYQLFNDESLKAAEVELLANQVEKLLNGELTKVQEMECIEPYFQFKFLPNLASINNSGSTGIQSDYQIVDNCMEWKTFFWNDGAPTNNYIAMTFYLDELVFLLNYLRLIMGRLDKESDTVKQMIQRGCLYGE
ncbi:MAG: hypothetical protein Q4A10_05120 [Aerococcaceae bacterium]|nr:hypothetical protein [Aerococcaceae bacterium]